MIAASDASSDTIFDDSRTTRSVAEGKSPVPADITLEAKRKYYRGLVSCLAMYDCPSAITAHSKMAVVVRTTVLLFLLFFICWEKLVFFLSRSTENHCVFIVSRIFQNHSKSSAKT